MGLLAWDGDLAKKIQAKAEPLAPLGLAMIKAAGAFCNVSHADAVPTPSFRLMRSSLILAWGPLCVFRWQVVIHKDGQFIPAFALSNIHISSDDRCGLQA